MREVGSVEGSVVGPCGKVEKQAESYDEVSLLIKRAERTLINIFCLCGVKLNLKFYSPPPNHDACDKEHPT